MRCKCVLCWCQVERTLVPTTFFIYWLNPASLCFSARNRTSNLFTLWILFWPIVRIHSFIQNMLTEHLLGTGLFVVSFSLITQITELPPRSSWGFNEIILTSTQLLLNKCFYYCYSATITEYLMYCLIYSVVLLQYLVVTWTLQIGKNEWHVSRGKFPDI